jgi:hypothetical protein
LILIPAAALYQRLSQHEPVTSRQLVDFLKILDHIVGKKFERFGTHLKQFAARRDVSATEAFRTITQPDDQIRELVEGIWKYFELTKSDADVDIRVALARMGQEHIEAFECFYPADPGPRSSVESLQSPESGFSTAKRTRRIVIVQDIYSEGRKKRGKRFVISRPHLEDEEGAMLCYPIEERHINAVPYVVSVCASKRGYFRNSEREKYEVILKRFAQRIVLEYCLKYIKEKAT